jgi:hypothetical protein
MQEPQRLEEAVLSEADLLELLGIDNILYSFSSTAPVN